MVPQLSKRVPESCLLTILGLNIINILPPTFCTNKLFTIFFNCLIFCTCSLGFRSIHIICNNFLPLFWHPSLMDIFYSKQTDLRRFYSWNFEIENIENVSFEALSSSFKHDFSLLKIIIHSSKNQIKFNSVIYYLNGPFSFLADINC